MRTVRTWAQKRMKIKSRRKLAADARNLRLTVLLERHWLGRRAVLAALPVLPRQDLVAEVEAADPCAGRLPESIGPPAVGRERLSRVVKRSRSCRSECLHLVVNFRGSRHGSRWLAGGSVETFDGYLRRDRLSQSFFIGFSGMVVGGDGVFHFIVIVELLF